MFKTIFRFDLKSLQNTKRMCHDKYTSTMHTGKCTKIMKIVLVFYMIKYMFINMKSYAQYSVIISLYSYLQNKNMRVS